MLFDAHGNRVCAKHKSDAFRETKTPRVVSEDKQKILDDSREIAQEYVTHMRLTHVLDKLGNPSDIESTGAVTKAMVEDVIAEAGDEIVVSREVRKAVSIEAAKMYRTTLSMEIPE